MCARSTIRISCRTAADVGDMECETGHRCAALRPSCGQVPAGTASAYLPGCEARRRAVGLLAFDDRPSCVARAAVKFLTRPSIVFGLGVIAGQGSLVPDQVVKNLRMALAVRGPLPACRDTGWSWSAGCRCRSGRLRHHDLIHAIAADRQMPHGTHFTLARGVGALNFEPCRDVAGSRRFFSTLHPPAHRPWVLRSTTAYSAAGRRACEQSGGDALR